MEERLQWHVEETQETLNTAMKDFTSRLTKLDEIGRKHSDELIDHDIRLESQLTKILERERVADSDGKKLEKCIVEIDNLQASKTD